jgi:hypothetical protein
MPKLTLNAKKHVIEKAKQIADKRATSVSAMFGEFVEALSAPRHRRRKPAPITRSVRGLAKVSAEKSDRELFEAAILAKDRR